MNLQRSPRRPPYWLDEDFCTCHHHWDEHSKGKRCLDPECDCQKFEQIDFEVGEEEWGEI